MSTTFRAKNSDGAVACGEPQSVRESATEFAWRQRLYARLRGQAYPLLVFEEGVLPAASLWAGARLWSAAFRNAGLQAGDRIVLALPPSPTFLYVLIASLWNGLTLALLAPGQDSETALQALDARCCIGGPNISYTWRLDDCGLPDRLPDALREAHSPPTPDARLLLATSGTTQSPRWVALSDSNLLAVLDSHAPLLYIEGARVLSVLPWHHAFGLIMDLLPALFAGAEIVRDRRGGRDPEHLRNLMTAHTTTHFNAVPLVIERLRTTPGGDEILKALQGGIVGGAAVNPTLAAFLSTTRLRAGYGQTEASPGIALGEPGEWTANLLGHPVGCQVRLDEAGLLSFSGANACLGVWQNGTLTHLPADRWVETGDIARQDGPNLIFLGRASDSFKLSNGRWIQPGELESALKMRFPHVREALIHSPDGTHLHLLTACHSNTPLPALDAVRECLGVLGAKLLHVRELPLSQWKFTPKGSLQRHRTLLSAA